VSSRPRGPRLRSGVRLVFDDVRGRHVLLYPEGVLLLNKTAAAVLGLCDGSVTADELIAELGRRYEGVAEADIQELLEALRRSRLLETTDD
jgi:pyrroloquinoline quinone biosynthesis protein D